MHNYRQGSHTIPGLDGLRALAVIAVVFYHLFPHVLPGGYIGVDIFFVISGFLITTLLINEHARTGHINLKKFWMRRARRLLPALFVTILVISSIAFFIRGDILVGIGQQILGAATFSSNWGEIAAGINYFENNSTHLFMNFWSLAVEEQFYFIWPFVILLLLSTLKKPFIGMIVTGILALASAGLMAFLFLHDAGPTRVYYGTDSHLFGLMIGALLAFWTRSKTIKQPLRRLTQPFWHLRRFPKTTRISGVVAFAGLGASFFLLPNQSALTYNGGLFLACIFAAVVLVATVSTNDWLQKLFSLRPLTWIGIRSYGIYLWHWPLLVLFIYLLPKTFPWWIVPLCVPVITVGLATLSYRYIEMPIRRHGFQGLWYRAFKKRAVSVDAVTTRTYIQPHSMVPVTLALCILTIGAALGAPTKTIAQMNIEKGQKAIHEQTQKKPTAKAQIHNPSASSPKQAPTLIPTDGNVITVIGDSVTLAASPYLQERFPGILINAEISRSLRRGGLETIEQFAQTGQLRPVVIVALGTNGYYGTDKLDELIAKLAAHKVVLVTAHAEREWTASNNDNVHVTAQKYKNIQVAEWDQMISAHPEFLSSDGIHPLGADGGKIYADSITEALKKLQ
jgi:peptidoglycan/LPS O-acetylase OafA/YrhL